MKITYFLILSLLFVFLSCDDDKLVTYDYNNPVYYHVKVDTLIIPDSISVNDTLIANVRGTLGPSACYSFSNFEVNWLNDVVTLKVIGKYVNVGCIQAFMCLDEDYKLNNIKQGYFKIKIINPENQFISDSVFIK